MRGPRLRLTIYVRHLAALAFAAGCLPPAMREVGQHPAPLAGDWVDLKHTADRDTALWRLAPDGTDLGVRVRTSTRGSRPAPDEDVSRHGVWFLRGTLGDTARRALCFNSRPGRAPTSCLRFALDTIADGRRRLVIADYRGSHETGTRTLVERR